MIQPAVVSSSSAFDEAARRRHLTRAVVASTVGTTVEWYDFFLYGSAAALVFPRLFFSDLDPALAQILSWVTFYAGFLGRPVGAAVFGHFGDRVGRKVLLVATMLLMGLSTTAIGLVPSYASIGIWGAVLLTMLRLLQGVAVGGEWSGSVLMAGEWAAPGKRGLMTSFPQMGSPLGLILANSALATLASVQDEAHVSRMGMADPVSRQPDPRRDRPLHSHWHSRIPGLCQHQGTGQDRARPAQGGDQGELARGRTDHVAAHGPARPVLHHDDVHPGVQVPKCSD